MSLLETLTTFHDWKAAVLLFSLTMFEHEGVSPFSLAELTALPEESRKTLQHLLNSNEETWREASVPEELLIAALETIGLNLETAAGPRQKAQDSDSKGCVFCPDPTLFPG